MLALAYKRRERNLRAAFTLVELVMVIMILGVLSSAGVSVMLPLIQNFIFIPNKLNSQMALSDAVDIIIDGDLRAKGLRSCRKITRVRRARVDFIDQNSQTVIYTLDGATQSLRRSINGGAYETFPGYASSAGVNFQGVGNTVFTYYDANESVTSNPSEVRLIRMTMTGRTGSGAYADWQGSSQVDTIVAVNPYQ
jgi:prepilin-type N-terminal cleavage/methylation domain-containing protein